VLELAAAAARVERAQSVAPLYRGLDDLAERALGPSRAGTAP
jgi:hypothetical protein